MEKFDKAQFELLVTKVLLQIISNSDAITLQHALKITEMLKEKTSSLEGKEGEISSIVYQRVENELKCLSNEEYLKTRLELLALTDDDAENEDYYDEDEEGEYMSNISSDNKCFEFIDRFKKQKETIGAVVFISSDPDEESDIFVEETGRLFLGDTLLPYSVEDVVKISHRCYDEDCDDNYVRIYFKNGDWLSISVLCEYVAKINGSIYSGTEVTAHYYSITNEKKIKQSFANPQEAIDKIIECLEKIDVWFNISSEEDEESEVWFDDNGFLWLDYDVRTPYTLNDIDSITYFNDEFDPHVGIYLKPEEDMQILLRADGSYHVTNKRYSFTHIEDISSCFKNIIEAKNLGIYDDEFVVVNSTLIKYNGNNTEIIIPEGVQYIAGRTFFESEITSLKCPATLKCIKERAFCCCRNLQEVVLNDGLETIEEYAFLGCEKLSKLYLPKTVKSIGQGAFERTPFNKE